MLRALGGGGAGAGGALGGVKRLLASRAACDRARALTSISEGILRCEEGSHEWQKVTQFMLEGDLCVFLCEAMGALDWTLVRSIMHCFKLLSSNKTFFEEHHWSCVVTSVVRTVMYYVQNSTNETAVDCCLHFVTETLTRLKLYKLPSILCSDTIYNTDQLLHLLAILAEYTGRRNNTSLAASMLLHSIINYQPNDLIVNVKYAEGLATVLEKWLPLLCGIMGDLNCIIDTENNAEIFYAVVCYLGMDSLRLCTFIKNQKQHTNFVQMIITSEEEISHLKQQTQRIAKYVYRSMLDVISYTKENCDVLSNNSYILFLQFLNIYMTEPINSVMVPSFSELLATSGYLSLLPKSRFIRNERRINELTANSLGEILCHLSRSYFGTSDVPQPGQYSVQMYKSDLAELHHDIEKWPQSLNTQLCQTKPYSLLVYLYFYLYTSERPEMSSGPLLPYLVQHLVGLPTSSRPPQHIVKCLWLVFAMASISNKDHGSFKCKLQVERATDRLARLVSHDLQQNYTHHPSLLLWCFTSDRISYEIKGATLALWLCQESQLPGEMSQQHTVLALLLHIVTTCNDRNTVVNACSILKQCAEEQTDRMVTDEFAGRVWTCLPRALHNLMLDYDNQRGVNLRCLVDLATELRPEVVDPAVYHQSAHLISIVFHKTYNGKANSSQDDQLDEIHYYCLQLAYVVLRVARKQDDNTALMCFVSRVPFLGSVLAATACSRDNVSCMALQLTSYILHYFAVSDCRCNTFLQLQQSTMVSTLYGERNNYDRRRATLQLLYTIFAHSNHQKPLPVMIADSGATEGRALDVFRALVFRVQMICCKESREKSATGWSILSRLLSYAISYKEERDTIVFATQPWMFTLVRFQLSQHITPQFLAFLKSWLFSLSIITQNDSSTYRSGAFIMRSLLYKTLTMTKRSILEYDTRLIDNQDQSHKIVEAIVTILDTLLNVVL